MLPRKKPGRSRWIIVIVFFLLAAVAVTLYFTRRDSELYESVKAGTGDISTYHSFSGNIEAKNRQTVISGMVMQISDIYVYEGVKVKKGDVLLETSTGDEFVADIDGEVANINIEKNAMVMAGSKLMEIVDYNNLEINVRVGEYDIGALKKGKEASVKIGALNKELKGKIRDISREGIFVNGLTYFTATLDLDRDQELRVGMSAEVRLVNSIVKGAITIPMSVVQFDENNKPYVLKEDVKGRPVRTDIVTGINNGTIVEVKEGVADGEAILYHNPDEIEGMSFRGPRSSRNSRNSGGTD